MREGYTLAYRSPGTHTHVGPSSFRLEGFTRHVGDLVSYSDQMNADELRPARTLVVTVFASTLCIVGPALALDTHEKADEIKQRFIAEAERSVKVQTIAPTPGNSRSPIETRGPRSPVIRDRSGD